MVLGAQTPPKSDDRASAYFNFAMGHVYAELAAVYGQRGDYVNKAIEHYKSAMKLDPAAAFLVEELIELYVQANQLRNAVIEAEAILRETPGNVGARRMLARIYTRLIGDGQQGKVNEEMVRKALEQYRAVAAAEPKDQDAWIMIGRLERVLQNSVDAEKAFKAALDLDPNSEDALTGLAMVYSDVGDTRNMVEMMRRVADRAPSLRSLSALAGAYEQMRDYASAAEVYRRALDVSPGNIQIKRSRAQSLLFSEQLDEALKAFTELAGLEPKDGQHQLRIAEIHRHKRDYASARAALAKARELDRNSLEIRYDEVNLLEAEGKIEEAIAALKAIVDETARKTYTKPEQGNRAMLLERLGGLYRNAHQHAKAAEAFREIAQVAPEAASRASVHVIDTWRMAKDFRKAEDEAKAAREKFPNERLVTAVYASLLADLGRAEEGAALIRPLLGGERDRETWLALAQIYEKGKNFAELSKAIDAAEKLSDSKEEIETIRFMRGAMHEKMKRFDLAEAEFRKVIEANPQSAGALNYLGYMLADRNVRLEEARQLIDKALEIDPHNGAYLDSLGWVYFRMNRLDDAETQLRRSLERTAGDPTVHDHLGDVYFRQGKIKDAIAQWQQSLREWESSSKADADPVEVAKVSKKLESARVRLAREGSKTPERQR
ncbi:MAG: tetratricopeptide repeat protein [Bryobacteraceae bacterium]